MKTTILVVEDEAVTQRLISAALENAGYEVLCASNIAMAEKAMSKARPDVVMLDWMLAEGSGVALTRRLRSDPLLRDIPILMLTSRDDECDKVTGLEAGADDYVTKPFSARELLARIHALLRRRSPESTDDLLEVAGLQIDPSLRRVMVNGQKLELSAIECRMLHFFATHPGRVFSREQILDKLWGDQVFVQDRTVDAHIRGLRHALRPTGHDVLIETVRGSGYCFRREGMKTAA
jgi:two-component system phosphate regulon response regulator PhoB